jgi:hypothetical protein
MTLRLMPWHMLAEIKNLGDTDRKTPFVPVLYYLGATMILCGACDEKATDEEPRRPTCIPCGPPSDHAQISPPSPEPDG